MCRKIIACILYFFLVFTVAIYGQNTNPCGVKAVLVPGNDSVITVPTGVSFSSASINATDYRLIFEPYQYPMNTPVTTGFAPGLTTVKLVAYNGTCTDTAVAYYFYPGTFPTAADNSRRLYGYGERTHDITGLIAVNGGGYLMAGFRYYYWYYNEMQQAMLIRTKQEGCVEWSRKMPSNTMYSSVINMVKEAAGGGFFLMGEVDYKRFIAKIDANGNLLWAEMLMDANGTALFSRGMEAMPDGGVVVTGIPYGGAQWAVIRLNSAGGIIWQKEIAYFQNVNGIFQDIAIKDNFLYIGGTIGSDSYHYDGLLTKMDYNNGQTVWTKKYEQSSGTMNLREIISVDSTLIINLGVGTNLVNTPSLGGLMRIDTSGQVLLAKAVGESYAPNSLVGPYNSSGSHLVRSGKTFYLLSSGTHSLSLQPYISYGNRMVKFDSTYKAEWVETHGGAGAPRFYFNASAPKDGYALGGDEIGSALNANGLGWLMSLKVIDSSGSNTTTNCWFTRQQFVSPAIPVTVQPTQWTIDRNAAFTVSGINIPWEPFFPEMRFKCPDYVDSCSYLKLSGQRSICNLTNTYTYVTHKNKSCGQPTQWTIPSNVQTLSQTGTSVTVRFPAFGRYVIYATNPLSCTPVQDSIVVIAASKTPPLNLGPDQQICPQNTTTLRAGPKFFTYKWQDGSTDSLLQVIQPGKYWVEVTDSCSNILSDTIYVTQAPPIPFYVGPDRTKCNNDTLRLQAPAGFINYSWGPAYNISGANTQVAIVNPLTDTTYTIMAEKTPGCFAYDTINISVYHSLPVNLGRDTGICMGNNVVLDAGAGFAQYQWSGGTSAQTLAVGATGNYAVIATTNEGCKSGDTIRINVFNNPDVELGNNNTLCEGSTRTLQAGNFASYLWQNGETASSITVTGLGKYYVRVTDNNRCIDSDTLEINRLLASPSKFLPADTIICSYVKLDVKPFRSFNKYLWSNGAISPVITVSPTGMYWLQVTDVHNCTGIDTVLIQPKDCLMGLYVPSGFTPNGDGKNDVFKPTLLGNIKAYEFSIYNRWGQRLYYSTDPKKGWDGRNGPNTQGASVFVWMCKYQLEGEDVKVARGTVTLVK
ncbi:gliding motility-associated C-terminal domain-containing protein [Niastella caeni]|uniref:Gliding motility-associated C-terminal domain-containing protein n=1 Tax=Niastella caeni TaxID=2569763 RepID=A0A4S8HZI3_9BACT|nr:gliding motility-associated C-terminal domain-containing protein [Niastella caeni]THU40985.1 gliding motility-associated C-terminal domain-containing protein [Niastella caeni]